MDCSDWECRHWKVLLSSSRRKSTWHPKHVRSCGEAGDFNDVTLAWKDGLLLTLKSESVDDSKQTVFWKWRTSRRCQRLAANPENGVWWRQICWKMFCFRAEAWMCHNHCGRKYSGFRAYAAKLLKLMPCDYTGNSVLGVVWSVATPSGNSFTYLHFIGSFYTVCFMSINCTLSLWGSRVLNLWKCENTRFFLLKHPEMLWNMWYYHLKWKEMLYLANPWCYGSKKILWI